MERNNVIQLFRCRRCGAPGTSRVGVKGGEEVMRFFGCDACVDEDSATLARVRPIFDAMLEAGIDRDLANDTMTFMLQKSGL